MFAPALSVPVLDSGRPVLQACPAFVDRVRGSEGRPHRSGRLPRTRQDSLGDMIPDHSPGSQTSSQHTIDATLCTLPYCTLLPNRTDTRARTAYALALGSTVR